MAPLRVFISYASDDYRVAQHLASRLRADGLHVPMDLDARVEVQDLELNGDAELLIQRSVDHADAFVVLISEAAYATPSIRSEWTRIVRRIWEDDAMIAVPVLLDDSNPPGFLSNHTLMRTKHDDEMLAGKVLRYLRHPPERGVHETPEGRIRHGRRLDEIERTATALVEAAAHQ